MQALCPDVLNLWMRAHDFPTVLELTGTAHPKEFKGNKIEPIRGKSLAGLLKGTTQTVYAKNDFVGGEMGNGKWMRQGDFKAVSISAPYGTGDWKLFNVVDDPGETKDLAKSHPDKLKKLQAAWDDYAKEVGVVLAE